MEGEVDEPIVVDRADLGPLGARLAAQRVVGDPRSQDQRIAVPRRIVEDAVDLRRRRDTGHAEFRASLRAEGRPDADDEKQGENGRSKEAGTQPSHHT